MKKKVTPEEFVKAWQSSDCLKDIAEKTGMTVPQVSARASNYRKLGVKLKSFGGVPNPIDVAKLNKLCK